MPVIRLALLTVLLAFAPGSTSAQSIPPGPPTTFPTGRQWLDQRYTGDMLFMVQALDEIARQAREIEALRAVIAKGAKSVTP